MDALSPKFSGTGSCGGTTEEIDNFKRRAGGVLFSVWIETSSKWMAFLSAKYIKNF
ncbi:hypothetical protein K440107A6_25750 [Lawsonibacter asaccharolyticus]